MNRLGKIAGADRKALTAARGRQCLQCAGQYDPGLVQMEREGFLDDPAYIEGLPRDRAFKSRENVFAFSMGCGNLQLLQMLAMALAPLDQPNHGKPALPLCRKHDGGANVRTVSS
jgi:molybdopterin-synthase adenylyltransferase